MEVLPFQVIQEEERNKRLAWDMRMVQASDKKGEYIFKEFKDFYNREEVIKQLDEGEETKSSKLLEIAKRNQEYLKDRR